MRFPIVNITSDRWNDWLDVECFILEETNYHSRKKHIIDRYYLNHKFCDSNGNIFISKRLNPVSGRWKKLVSLIPGTIKGKVELNPTTQNMDLNEFKSFILNKVKEMNADQSTMEWIGIIHSAKTYEEILRPDFKNSG